MTGAVSLPVASLVAVLRSSFPSSRSSCRTPASRVYCETTGLQLGVRHDQLVLEQARAVSLARPEVPTGDRDLLVDRVPVEADDLHPVEQGAGDGVGDVGGGDEHDLGQVEFDVEVVIAERVVLRRIEHLEEGVRRVSAPVGADLVDLVEEDHRVHRPGVAQGTDEPARQRADVGAAVAADLRLVAHAAERHADELAVERAGDRLADRGLPGAGRPDQREDRAGALVLGDAPLLAELANGQVLDDAVLDILEACMVGVEDLAGVDGIEPLLGALRPRHGKQPVEVGADHRGLGGVVAHPLEAAGFALGLLANGVGHAGLGDLPAVVLGDGLVVLAELLADRLHLLAQHVLALLLGSALLDILTDPAPNLLLGEPLALEAEGELQPLDDVDRLEQLDLLVEGEVGGVRARVGELAHVADRADERRHAAVVAAQLEDLLDRRAVLGLELAGLDSRRLLVGPLGHLDPEVPLRIGVGGAELGAVQPLEGHSTAAAGHADAIADLGNRAHLGVLTLVPRDEQHALLVGDLDSDGHVHVREDDNVVERYEEQ